MKLREKKTGEVFDALIREKGGGGTYSIIVCDIKAYEQSKSTLDVTHFILGEYDSLAELNEEWEDYKPAEPLIKDEKIRKAVRTWAEANRYDKLWVYHGRTAISFYNADNNDNGITLNTVEKFGLEHLKCYTITELCGEEEE